MAVLVGYEFFHSKLISVNLFLPHKHAFNEKDVIFEDFVRTFSKPIMNGPDRFLHSYVVIDVYFKSV